MPIRPIDYAVIQRASDVESYRHQEETKPLYDQQNIQTQVNQREDALRHQVLDPQDNNKAENHADAREEGKGQYTRGQKTEKKKRPQSKTERVIRKQSGGFDMKI